MRRLIYIPIIHTSADLGSLSEAVRSHYAKLCGESGWSRREQMVEALWADIRAGLESMHLDAKRVRIYQDGLPICGFEERIVRELAQAGSSNHQLILRFLDQGATVMGTEDPRLLMEEYEIQKESLEDRTQNTPAQQEDRKRRSDHLLQSRDTFIVERIAATLQQSEVGLLFLGALHRLDGLKATDIRWETLGGGAHEAVWRPRT